MIAGVHIFILPSVPFLLSLLSNFCGRNIPDEKTNYYQRKMNIAGADGARSERRWWEETGEKNSPSNGDLGIKRFPTAATDVDARHICTFIVNGIRWSSARECARSTRDLRIVEFKFLIPEVPRMAIIDVLHVNKAQRLMASILLAFIVRYLD